MYSKAQMRATDKYVKANFDRFNLRLPKGYRDEIALHCNSTGESINAFINRAIRETIERDSL